MGSIERLILRSILYGADKIPDSWFDKIPGGFYKSKEVDKKTVEAGKDRIAEHKRANRYEDGDGYRSEGHRRRHHRSRSSFDGGADDDDYYISEDDGRRKRRTHRRRRSVDDDRRGQEGHRRSHRREYRDPYEVDRDSYARHARPSGPYYERERPSTGGGERGPNPFAPGSYAAVYTNRAPYPQSTAHQSPRSGSFPSPNFPPPPNSRNGYVPYSNVYGQYRNQPQQSFSTPPSSVRSPRPGPDTMVSPPMAPPPQGYQQNPFAQQAATAADAGAGASYTGEPGIMSHNPGQDPRWAEPNPYQDPRQYPGYENDTSYPESISPRRMSRQDYSLSHSSYDSRAYDRRSRSERRPDDDKARTRGKSLTQMKEKFDTTHRGIGYSAVGAVAGGLVGSEFGKGAVPTAIGATMGALGANTFEAREKYVQPPPLQGAQMPAQPASWSTSRRKDGKRESEFHRDGTYEKRDARRRREDGYYSD